MSLSRETNAGVAANGSQVFDEKRKREGRDEVEG